MDSITPDDPAGRGRIQAARIRQAAVDAGIGPDNALAPFVAAIAQATEEITEAPGEVELRIAPVLAEMRAFTEAAIEAAASRPLVTEHQLKWTVLLALLAAREVWHWGMLALMFVVGVVAALCWDRYHASPPPDLTCGAFLGNRPICFRFDGPPTEQPAQQQQEQPPAAPTPAAPTKTTPRKP